MTRTADTPAITASSSSRIAVLGEYEKALNMLESRRGQLIMEKTGLETRIRDFQNGQARKMRIKR
jgi:hypothetical protein